MWEQTQCIYIVSLWLCFLFSQKYPGQVSLSFIDIIMNHLSAATDKKAVKRMRWFFRLCRKWQNENNCGALQLRKDINMGGQRRESERGHNGARSARLWSASLITLIVEHDSTINLVFVHFRASPSSDPRTQAGLTANSIYMLERTNRWINI